MLAGHHPRARHPSSRAPPDSCRKHTCNALASRVSTLGLGSPTGIPRWSSLRSGSYLLLLTGIHLHYASCILWLVPGRNWLLSISTTCDNPEGPGMTASSWSGCWCSRLPSSGVIYLPGCSFWSSPSSYRWLHWHWLPPSWTRSGICVWRNTWEFSLIASFHGITIPEHHTGPHSSCTSHRPPNWVLLLPFLRSNQAVGMVIQRFDLVYLSDTPSDQTYDS